MAEIFRLPKIGDAMAEAEIVEWYVAIGDEVALDQVICSVETDKSMVELSSPYRGTVLALAGEPGDVVEVGEPLFAVGAPGEAVPSGMTAGAQPASVRMAPEAADSAGTVADCGVGASGGAGLVASPLVRRLAASNGVELASVSGSGVGGRVTRADVLRVIDGCSGSEAVAGNGNGVRAMPKVRKAAREMGIDIADISGTGPAGAVTLADLEPASESAMAVSGLSRRGRLTALRRSIATHLTESARNIPQFTAMVDFDASGLLATRSALRERLQEPVPIDAVFMALLIPVLRDHPIVNACLDTAGATLAKAEIVYFDRYDIGIATDTPDGLMVPVVRDADQLDVSGLAAEITRLASASRDRTIEPAELSGATCTINNVGAVGIEAGTPMLPLGTSTIVAFGATRPVVQLRNGNPVEIPTMTISATFDHRLIDGGTSGRFLTQLRRHLEVPALGLI